MLPFDRRDAVDHEAAADAALGLKARPLASELIALEPRMVFDGAAAATAAAVTEPTATDATGDASHDVAADMVAAAVKLAAAVQPAATKDSSDADAEKPAVADTAPSSASEEIHELVFIDTRVTDSDAFAKAAGPGRLVIKVEAGEDGFDVISKTLAAQTAEISAIHIIGHGSEARASLGSTAFDAETVAEKTDVMQGWQTYLTADADILFYGCNIAAGDDGAQLIASIAKETGADVAASADDVGMTEHGLDWSLETATGAVEAKVVAPESYLNRLAVTKQPGVRFWNANASTDLPRTFAPGSDGQYYTTVYTAATGSNAATGSDTSLAGTKQTTKDTTPAIVGPAGSAIVGATIYLYDLDMSRPEDVTLRTLLGTAIVDKNGGFTVFTDPSKSLSEGNHLLGVTQKSGNDQESDPVQLLFTIDLTKPADPQLNTSTMKLTASGSLNAYPLTIASGSPVTLDQSSFTLRGNLPTSYSNAARVLGYILSKDGLTLTTIGAGADVTYAGANNEMTVGANGAFVGTFTTARNDDFTLVFFVVDQAYNPSWTPGTSGWPVTSDGKVDLSAAFTVTVRARVALGANLATFTDDTKGQDVSTSTTAPTATGDTTPQFSITGANPNATYTVTGTLTSPNGTKTNNIQFGTFRTDSLGKATFTPTNGNAALAEGTYDLSISGVADPDTVQNLPSRTTPVTTTRFEISTTAKAITFGDSVGLKTSTINQFSADPNPTGALTSDKLPLYNLTDGLTVNSAGGIYRAPGSIITIDYYVDGSTTKNTATTTVRADGGWSCVLPADVIGYGAHRVRVVVSDSAGRVTSDAWAAIYQTAPWSPGGIGISDLQLWYDFSQDAALVYSSGNLVAGFRDMSGNNRAATLAPGANPGASLIGSYGAQLLGFNYDVSKGGALYNIAVPFNTGTLFYSGDLPTALNYGTSYPATLMYQVGNMAFYAAGLSAPNVGNIANSAIGPVTAFFLNNTSKGYNVNGVQAADGSINYTSAIGTLGRNEGYNSFVGNMGAVISYKSVLTASQLTLVQQALAQRFGTSLTSDLYQAGALVADRADSALQFKYSQDVGGIIRTLTDAVSQSANGGLLITDSTTSPFLKTDASILFGNNGGGATFGPLSSAETPANPGISGLGRNWAVDIKGGNANGKIDLSFDIASLISSTSSNLTVQNLVDSFAGRTNLKLAWRASEADPWSFINSGTLVVKAGTPFDPASGRVTFKDVTVGATGLRTGFITLLDGPTLDSITPNRSTFVDATQREVVFTVKASESLNYVTASSFKVTWLTGATDPQLTVSSFTRVDATTYQATVTYSGTSSGAINFDYDYQLGAAAGTDARGNAVIKTETITASMVQGSRLTGPQVITFTFSSDLLNPASVTNQSVGVDSGTLGPITYNDANKSYSALYTPASGAQNNKIVKLNIQQGLQTAEGATRPLTLLLAVDNVRPTLTAIELWSGGSVSSNGAAANALTNRQTLQYKVTFSEAVTDVDAADFVLTKAAGLTGAITSVVRATGDGTVWFVNVDPVAGTGAARLSLSNTATINDVLVDPTGTQVGIAGNAMNTFSAVSASYNFDSTAPTLSFATSPTVSNGSTLSFDLTFSEDMDASTMSPLAFGTVNDLPNVDISMTQSTTNPRVWTVTLSGIGISQREGAVQLRYKSGYLRDIAGNPVKVESAPTPPSVTMDHKAPDAPSMTQSLTNSTKPTLSGTVEKGAKVTVSLGSTVLATIPTTTTNWTFTPTASLGLVEGANQITLVATDAAGNASAPATVNLTLDTIRPTIASFSPVARYTKENYVSYDLTFSEAVTGLQNSNFTASSLLGGTLTVAATSDPKVWRVTVSNMSSAGDITVTYKPTTAHKDSANNTVSGTDIAATATRDVTAPDAPTLPNLYVNTALKTLTGAAEASSTVTIGFGGATYTAALNGTTWSWTPPADSPLLLGANAIRVTVTDRALNATSKDFVVTLDQTAPTVSIARSNTTPTNAGSVYFDLTFDEAVNAPTAANFTTVENLSNVTFAVTKNVTPANSWRVALSGTGISGRTGPVTLALTTTAITDLAGNPVAALPTATITVDHTPPDVAVASATYLTNNAQPTITGTVEVGATLKVTYKSVVYTLTPIDGAWSWTPPSALSAGATALTFTATDAAGNNASASTTITLDQTAPTATISRWSGGTATGAGAAATTETFNVTDRQFKIVLSEDLGELTASKILVTGGTINGQPIRSGATNTWFVNVTPSAGTGPLSVSLTGVADQAKNAVVVSAPEKFTRDSTAPSLTSIARASGASAVTNATSLSFVVTFSEAVLNVTADSFVVTDESGTPLTGASKPTISSVVASDAQTYTVSLSNTAKTLDGSAVSISLASTAGVKDAADNAADVSASVTREAYTLDYTAPKAPTLAKASVSSTRPTLNGTTEAGSTVSIQYGGTTYAATVTGTEWSWTPPTALTTGANDLVVTATDVASNVSTSANLRVTVDLTSPTVTSVTPSTTVITNASSGYFDITFSEAIDSSTITTASFSTVGGLNVASVTNSSGNTWRVSLADASAVNGVVTLSYVSPVTIKDLAGNPLSVASNTIGSISFDHVPPNLSASLGSASVSTSAGAPTKTSNEAFAVAVVTDADANVTWSVTKNGVASSDFAFTTTPTGGTIAKKPGVTLTKDTYVIAVTARDNAENATTATYYVQFVSTASATDIKLESGTAIITTGGAASYSSANLTFTASYAATGSARIDIANSNGVTVVSNAAPTKTTGDRWAYTLPASVLAEGGPYAVTITVFDTADRPATETFAYTIDRTAPTLSSLERLSPAGGTTNASSVSFKATFSERVTSVDGADFVVLNGSGQSITGVTVSAVAAPGDTTGTIWNVSVSNIPASFNGELSLKLASPATVFDSATNTLAASTLSAAYTLDQTGPSISSVIRSHSAVTNADAIYFDVAFSEAVDASTISADNFSTNAGSVASVTGSGTTWRVAVSGVNNYNGSVQLSLASPATIKDVVGNSLTNTAGQIGAAIVLDNTAPTLSVAADRSATNASTASFVASFNETMDASTITASQFTVNAGTISSVTRIGATNDWRVTVQGLDSFTGTLSLGLAASSGMRDVAGNLATTNASLWGATTVERTAPTANVRPSTTVATNADSISFDIEFNEPMDAATISADSFTVNAGTLSVAKVTGANTWRVTVSGAAIQNYNGAVELRLSNTASIKDVAGNVLDRAANALLGSITLDNAAPALSATLNNVALTGLSGTTSQADFALALTANETATLSIDTVSSAKFGITKTGSVWTITRKSGVTLALGSYQITVTAVDGLGNRGDTVYTIQLLASSAVSVSSLSAGDGTGQVGSGAATNLSSGRLNLTADYTTAKSVAVSIVKDGVTIASGAATKTNSANGWTFDLGASALTDGASYTVTATAKDFADIASTPATFSYTSDKTAPVATLSLSDRLLKSGETTMLTIASTETIKTFDASKVSVTGGTLGAFVRSADGKSYSAVFTPSAGQARATASLSLAAGAVTDAANNVSAATGDYSFVVDTKAPTLASILRNDANTAARVKSNASSVEFVATFSEGVVNVGAADFATYRNGALLASTITVTAQGANAYLVTVSNFVGDGDIDLRLATGATVNDLDLTLGAASEVGNALTDLTTPAGARGFTVDRTGPTISAITAGALSNGTRTVTISFSEAIDPDTFSIADLSFDASLGSLSNLSVSADRLSATVTYSEASNVSGAQTISVASAAFTDVLGNDNAASARSVTFNVDTKAPSVLSILRQSPLAQDTNANSVTFRVTFDEAVTAVDAMDFVVNSLTGSTVSDLTVVNVGSAGTTFDVTVAGSALASLQTGTISLGLASGASITDRAGNALSQANLPTSETFIFNRSGYRISSGVLADDVGAKIGETSLASAVVTDDSRPVFTFTSVNPLSSVSIYEGATLRGTATSSADGKTWTWAPNDALAEGVHNYTARSTDASGGFDTFAFKVTLDTIAPTKPSVLTYNNASAFSNNPRPSISGTAEAGSRVTVAINGVALSGGVTADIDGVWSVSSDQTLDDGAYAITATATDEAGNASATSDVRSITVDTSVSAPMLTAFQGTPIGGGVLLSSSASPVLSGSGEAGAVIRSKIWRAGTQEPSDFSPAEARVGGDGAWSVTPAALADGLYLARFQIKDPATNVAASVEYSFIIDTTAPVLPVIAPGALSVAENSQGVFITSVAATDLTAVTYAITSQGSPFMIDASGRISLSGSANLDYETGPRSYDVIVQATDAAGNTASRTYVIAVTDVNEAPSAGAALGFRTLEDVALSASVTGFADPDQGETLTYRVSQNAGNGLVQMTSAGAFTYLPRQDFNGTDVFEVTVTDRGGLSAKKSITITVDPVNDAPVVGAAQSLSIFEESAASGFVTATDVDGDRIAFRVATQGAHGRATINDSGAFTYRPDENFFGEDSFSIEVSDGQASVFQRVTIRVANVDDAPMGGVSISGSALVGQTLTASAMVQDADGLGALSYQWFSNNVPVYGARAPVYTVRGEDTGAALKVVVTYVDGGGKLETVPSDIVFVPAAIASTAPSAPIVESKTVSISTSEASAMISVVDAVSTKSGTSALSTSSFTTTNQIAKSSTVMAAVLNDPAPTAISSIVDAKPLAIVTGGRVSSTIVVPTTSVSLSSDVTGSTPSSSADSAARSAAGGASLSSSAGIASRMQISSIDRGAVFEVRIATPASDSNMARVLGENVRIVGGGDAVYKFGSSIFVKRGQGKVSFSLEVVEPSGERVIVPMTIDPTSGSIEITPAPRGALGDAPLSFAELLRRETDPQIDQLLASLAGAGVLGVEATL